MFSFMMKDSEEPGAVKNKENKSRGYKRSAAPLEGVQEETNDSVHDRNGELIESADDYPLSQRVDKYKRTRNTANRNEASTSREEPIGRNIHAPHLCNIYLDIHANIFGPSRYHSLLL